MAILGHVATACPVSNMMLALIVAINRAVNTCQLDPLGMAKVYPYNKQLAGLQFPGWACGVMVPIDGLSPTARICMCIEQDVCTHTKHTDDMYVYMYVYIFTHTHMCIYIYICTRTLLSGTYTCRCMHIYNHVYLFGTYS